MTLPPETVRALLSHMGITESEDISGQKTWSIDVRESDVQSGRKARFDPGSGSWVLDSYATDNNQRSSVPSKTAEKKSSSSIADGVSWWTHVLPDTEHTKFLVTADWPSTPLGPISSWPSSLQHYTSIILSESRATILFWGTERVAIYNEASIPLLGRRHPRLMGGGIAEQWQEASKEFSTYFDELKTTGNGMMLQNIAVPLERHDSIQETWWDVDLLPLKEDDGTTGGFCLTWLEITKQVITDRFSRIVNEIGNNTHGIDGDVWQHIHKVFCRYPEDVAMCVLYSATNIDDDKYHRLKREATIGVHTAHQTAPPFLDLDNDTTGFVPTLRKVLEDQDEFAVLDTKSTDFPSSAIESIDWKGYGEPSKSVAVIPIQVFNNLLKGFVILGLNPRIPMDASHQQFLADLSRQLGALMTTVTTAEQAKRREEKLLGDLAGSEKRIRKMAQLAPMGMYDLSAEGKLLWANTHFFDILGANDRQKNFKTFSWLDFILPDDHEAAKIKMASSIIEQATISDSLRLRKTWCPPDVSGDQAEASSEEPAWILYQAYPHIENGVVESIMGCITDISQFKWAETVQARSANAARAAKQRLEDFIDITSHEMRNPLSAVTQCADDILGSVDDARKILGQDRAVLEELHQIADTAKSIALCASHQRRIIDDVLTLSKLDSALLSVVPVASRPGSLISDAMRMFAAEFASSGIQVDIIDETPGALGPQEVCFYDATRLMQVLVNLITNAIKFTRAEDKREVVITYGVSNEPPTEKKFSPYFAWSTSMRKRRDLSADVRYGDGATVYLSFSVRDTGQGLPREEAVHIFDKFIQANRRTYIKYGGSGLGLFISRELIELQSGKIGVASETGKGSIFAFYVKSKLGLDSKFPTDSAGGERTTLQSSSRGRNNSLSTAADSLHLSPSDKTDAKGPTTDPGATPDGVPSTFHILLVEDNLVNQKVLAKQLRKAGFMLTIANHGGEAVDRLLHNAGRAAEYETAPVLASPDRTRFDCILMDWEMPVLDGLSATRRIRDLEADGTFRTKQVIIGVTANARMEQIKLAEAAGMDEIVVKPFRVPDLIERMAAATGVKFK